MRLQMLLYPLAMDLMQDQRGLSSTLITTLSLCQVTLTHNALSAPLRLEATPEIFLVLVPMQKVKWVHLWEQLYCIQIGRTGIKMSIIWPPKP